MNCVAFWTWFPIISIMYLWFIHILCVWDFFCFLFFNPPAQILQSSFSHVGKSQGLAHPECNERGPRKINFVITFSLLSVKYLLDYLSLLNSISLLDILQIIYPFSHWRSWDLLPDFGNYEKVTISSHMQLFCVKITKYVQYLYEENQRTK